MSPLIDYMSAAVAAGYPNSAVLPLVPATAPRETLDRFDAADLGKAPAFWTPENGWRRLRDWQHGCPDSLWGQSAEAGANAGLRLGVDPRNDGRCYVFVDIDPYVEADDSEATRIAEVFSDKVVQIIVGIIKQPLWVRRTRKGRAGILLRVRDYGDVGTKVVYRFEHPKFPKVYKIEFLTAGQQVGFAGVHLSGRQIEWYRTDNGTVAAVPPAAEIPLVTDAAEVQTLLRAVCEHLRAISGMVISEGRERQAVDHADGAAAEPAPSVDLLVELLEALPHDRRVARELYVATMLAAAGCVQSMGLAVADAERVKTAAVNWACRWQGPAGESTDWTVEAEKWDNDFSRQPVAVGWNNLIRTAADLGDTSYNWKSAQVQFAQLMKPVPKPAELMAEEAADAEVIWPPGFRMTAAGLMHYPGGDTGGLPEFVCARFEVIGETRDTSQESWGLLLEWADPDGAAHTWAMPRALIHEDGGALTVQLENRGLRCATGRPSRDLLKAALGGVKVDKRITCVDRPGWHTVGEGHTFIHPNGKAICQRDETVALQSVSVNGAAFGRAGDLAEWQQQVAAYAIGNSRVALFICAALAGPLLDIVVEPTGGIHLVGPSQTGKSTAAFVAGSVWGRGDRGAQVRNWRATANGLEGVAAECCDTVLILDEIGQADSREVGEIVYGLANEAGKARADRSGGARRRKAWRILFLSTGEVPLSQKMAEAGRRTMAGQEVRMVTLPADAGAGLGAFEDLHNLKNAAALADHLRAAAKNYFGSAGVAFVECLSNARNSDEAGLRARIAGERAEFLNAHLPDAADGQVRSVAARFALLAAAGEMATRGHILPWPAGEATRAAAACFRSYMAERGGADSGEDAAAVAQACAFLESHGESRFTRISGSAATNDEYVYEQTRTINRAGFRRTIENADGTEWEFLIMSEAWNNEIFKGADAKRAAAVLLRRGFLHGDDGRTTSRCRIPGIGQLRLYRLSGSILAA